MGSSAQVVRVACAKSAADACSPLLKYKPILKLIIRHVMNVKRRREEGNEPDEELAHKTRKDTRRMGIESLLNDMNEDLAKKIPPPRAEPDDDLIDLFPDSGSAELREERLTKVMKHWGLPLNSHLPEVAKVKEALADLLASDAYKDVVDDTLLPFLSTGKFEKRGQAPIVWLKDGKQYSIRELLENLDVEINLPQMFDASPRLRREMAELLRSSEPRSRKARKPTQTKVVSNVLSEYVSSAADKDVECLYITAMVNGEEVHSVLIDGGAQVDLVSEKVVDKLNLQTYPCDNLAIRLANDQLVKLPRYAWINVAVSGIMSKIKAYVMPIEASYHLLLSRRWTSRVRAIEDHATNTMIIRGTDGIKRLVKGERSSESGFNTVPTNSKSHDVKLVIDDDDEEADAAVEALLDELDHWDEDTDSESGNGVHPC